jgi:transcriptional regulator with XRE-family HTH domain
MGSPECIDHARTETRIGKYARSPFGDWLIDRVAELNDGKGMSMYAFAKLCGMAPAHPGLLVRGTYHPSPQTIKRIAEVFKLTFEEVWELAEESRKTWTAITVRNRQEEKDRKKFMVKITVYTTPENLLWLEDMARVNGDSKSGMVTKIIDRQREEFIRNSDKTL